MSIKRCRLCNKELPFDSEQEVCSLCCVGLTPTSTPGWDLSRDEPPMVIQSRQLTGIQCPRCSSELTQADVQHLACAICGAKFSTERLRALQQMAITRRSQIAMRIVRSPREHRDR